MTGSYEIRCKEGKNVKNGRPLHAFLPDLETCTVIIVVLKRGGSGMQSVLLSQTVCNRNIPCFLRTIFQIAFFSLTFHVSVDVLILQEGQSTRLQKSRGNSFIYTGIC